MNSDNSQKPPRFIDRHRLQLDPAHVPAAFHSLIPLAEKWGIHYVEELDDFEIRNILFDEATEVEIDDLLDTLQPYMNAFKDPYLYQWLAGTEAQSKTMTKEYLAFTFMGMAYDAAMFIHKDE